MKQLPLALVALLAGMVVSDVTLARGGGFSGGAGVSGGGGGHHGGGGYRGGGHADGRGGVWHGGGYANRWHGSGWRGPGFGIYLGNLANWGAWPPRYDDTYSGYYPYATGNWDAVTVDVGPEQQAASAPTWDAETVYVEPEQQATRPPIWDAATIYVEPEQQAAPLPAYYWYYCTDLAGYFPYVQNCDGAWMTVVPQR